MLSLDNRWKTTQAKKYNFKKWKGKPIVPKKIEYTIAYRYSILWHVSKQKINPTALNSKILNRCCIGNTIAEDKKKRYLLIEKLLSKCILSYFFPQAYTHTHIQKKEICDDFYVDRLVWYDTVINSNGQNLWAFICSLFFDFSF